MPTKEESRRLTAYHSYLAPPGVLVPVAVKRAGQWHVGDISELIGDEWIAFKRMQRAPGIGRSHRLGRGFSASALAYGAASIYATPAMIWANMGYAEPGPPDCSSGPPGSFLAGPRIFDGGICPLQTEVHPAAWWDAAVTTGAGTGLASEWYMVAPYGAPGYYSFKQTKGWPYGPETLTARRAFPRGYRADYEKFGAPRTLRFRTPIRRRLNRAWRRSLDKPGERQAYELQLRLRGRQILSRGRTRTKYKDAPPRKREREQKRIFRYGKIGVAASVLGDVGEVVGCLISSMPKSVRRDAPKALHQKAKFAVRNADSVNWTKFAKCVAKNELEDLLIAKTKRFGMGSQTRLSEYYRSPVGPTTGWAYTRPPRPEIDPL